MKKMTAIWAFIAILLFVGLITIAVIYKQKTKKYKELENKLVEITKKYTATDFNFPKDKELVITYSELKEEGLIKKLETEKNKCNGYVILTFDNVTKYKGYVDCKVYKTHGYDKSKIDN